MPQIYWDGYGLGKSGSGVFVYARSLATELGRLNVRPTLVGESGCTALFPDLPCMELAEYPLARRLGRLKPIWPLRVGRAVAEVRAEVTEPYILHGLSNFNIPYLHAPAPMRRLITVHDLIPLLVPGAVSAAYFVQFSTLMPRVLRAAHKVICVSAWTRATVARYYPWAVEKCVVIPNGIAAESSAKAPAEGAQESLALPAGLATFPRPDNGKINVLYVARYERYKQHQVLLELLNARRLSLHITVVTDARGAQFYREKAAKWLGDGTLILHCQPSASVLHEQYARADVYLHPSLYEGYCLPAAEALAAGVPVVYRPGSGIDEVAGKTVGFPVSEAGSVNPAAWAEAIELAFTVRQAPNYSELLRQHRATLFTWQAAAAALAKLYRNCAP